MSSDLVAIGSKPKSSQKTKLEPISMKDLTSKMLPSIKILSVNEQKFTEGFKKASVLSKLQNLVYKCMFLSCLYINILNI